MVKRNSKRDDDATQIPPADQTFTELTFGDQARQELFEGLSAVAEAVAVTMGPKGRTVLIQNGANTVPVVTKDGVTVSRSINFRDPAKRMGAQLIQQAASQTNDVAGDGTTTATVLTHAMVSEGLKLLGAGCSSTDLKRGIELGVERALSSLRDSARPVQQLEEIVQVATISANGDSKIGELIASAMSRVGDSGIITVEDAKGMQTTLDVVEGMQFDRGYMSPYFVTQNNEKLQAIYRDALVLLTDKKIGSLKEIVSILEEVNQANRALLIIADDYDGDALPGLVLNRQRGNLKVIAIKAPGYGFKRDALLADLAALTGGQVISAQTGTSLEKIRMSDLGSCAKVTVDRNTTTLVSHGTSSKIVDAVSKRVEELKLRLAEDVTMDVAEREFTRQRIAKLSSGVAIIRVGGTTEVEMVERKHRIEDALNATRAAAEEGILPGGGLALLRAASEVESIQLVNEPADVKFGLQVVAAACRAPFQQIVRNAGKNPDVVFHVMGSITDQSVGYNAASDSFVDLLGSGIVDPLKVTRCALENAVSVALIFLSLDAIVLERERT